MLTRYAGFGGLQTERLLGTEKQTAGPRSGNFFTHMHFRSSANFHTKPSLTFIFKIKDSNGINDVPYGSASAKLKYPTNFGESSNLYSRNADGTKGLYQSPRCQGVSGGIHHQKCQGVLAYPCFIAKWNALHFRLLPSSEFIHMCACVCVSIRVNASLVNGLR